MKLMQRRGLLYPAALAVFLLGVLLWFFNRYDFSVQVESAPPAVLPQPDAPPQPSPLIRPSVSEEPRLPETPKAAPPQQASRDVNTPQPPVRPGRLRVGNPTEHPLRLALLRQLPQKSSQSSSFDQPIHWDFAPQEGGDRGLLLSLPSGNLEIREGDVLVAFAQDGSGRYWGPYVVGETPGLGWQDQPREWTLILQP